MLGRRLLAAAIIISVLLLFIWGDFVLGTESQLGRPGLLLAVFAMTVSGMAAGELVEMFSGQVNWTNRSVPVIGAISMVGVACVPLLWRDYPTDCPLGYFGWSMSGVTIAIVISFFYEMLTFRVMPETTDSKKSTPPAAGDAIQRLGFSCLIFGYLSLFFGFIVAHRMINQDNGLGLLSIALLISTVKMSDAFAYFAGKTLGTIKIAPGLSPKKTLEGSIGAFVGGVVAAAIVVFVIAPYFDIDIGKPWWWFVLYGVVVTLAGMAGDFAESLLKRDSQCKDSSSWLPGLGGILDIIDSLIFATPVSFVLWLV